MTARDERSAPPTTGICPSWETLSCYADSELPADEAAAVERHLAQCRPCSTLVQVLPALIAAPLPHPDSGETRDCPTAEALLGALAAPRESDATVAAHIGQCDVCVGRLALLARQSPLEDLAAVPAAVVARAAAAAQPGPQGPLELRATRQHTPVWLRLPVLLPLAFAAGIVALVGTQHLQGTFAAPGERWRAVPAQPAVQRGLTSDTQLRMAARPDSDVITVVRRGTTVEIIAEQADWLHVALPDGRHGWAPRRAFE